MHAICLPTHCYLSLVKRVTMRCYVLIYNALTKSMFISLQSKAMYVYKPTGLSEANKMDRYGQEDVTFHYVTA